MVSLRLSCALMVFIASLAASTLVAVAYAGDGNGPTLAVKRAEAETAAAYQSVLDAERTGANVSDLLVRLNEAGEKLAKAETAFTLGDIETVIAFANLSSEISKAVKVDADKLRLETSGQEYANVWIRMVGSILGVIVVCFGSLWMWRICKRRYYKRVLKMKPEVASSEP